MASSEETRKGLNEGLQGVKIVLVRAPNVCLSLMDLTLIFRNLMLGVQKESRV